MSPSSLASERKGLHVRDKKLFTRTKINTHCKALVCPVALECGLKDLSCFTEWIDVCFKHISEFV